MSFFHVFNLNLEVVINLANRIRQKRQYASSKPPLKRSSSFSLPFGNPQSWWGPVGACVQVPGEGDAQGTATVHQPSPERSRAPSRLRDTSVSQLTYKYTNESIWDQLSLARWFDLPANQQTRLVSYNNDCYFKPRVLAWFTVLPHKAKQTNWP